MKTKANKKLKARKDEPMVEMREAWYTSPFDKYQVQMLIGPAKGIKQVLGFELPKSIVSGATLKAENHGCLIWLRSLGENATVDEICTFFHEVTHASVERYLSNGMLKELPTPKSKKSEQMFDLGEMIATSVSEIASGLLNAGQENPSLTAEEYKDALKEAKKAFA